MKLADSDLIDGPTKHNNIQHFQDLFASIDPEVLCYSALIAFQSMTRNDDNDFYDHQITRNASNR